MAGGAAPGGDSGVVAVDLDATIVVAHSEKAARLALAQLPRRLRGRVLIRADSGGGTHEFLTWRRGRGGCATRSA